MAEIYPFRGLRYNPSLVGDLSRVVSPPYDVISKEEAGRLEALSPYNAVHIDLPNYPGAGTDISRYEKAGRLFREWVRGGILQKEPQAAIYAYRQTYKVPGTNEVRRLLGMVGALRLAAWEEGVVLPHEHTFAKPKADRLNLMRATEANLSQVYSFYSDPALTVEKAWEPLLAGRPPAVAVPDGDGNLHELWPVTEPGALTVARELIAQVPVFIADGHHRYETALDYEKERAQKAGSAASPKAQWHTIMMMLVNLDAGGLTILPTHRVITCPVLPKAGDELYQALLQDFEVERRPEPGAVGKTVISTQAAAAGEVMTPAQAAAAAWQLSCGEIGLYTRDGGFWLLKRREAQKLAAKIPGNSSAACKNLDVTVLHEIIIKQIIGLTEQAPDGQLPIMYTRDAGEACAAVAAGEASAAFLLPAPMVKDVRDVALAGDVMPHKSTYFYPKLLTGLVFSDLNDVLAF
ncbi:MAG TPA: DUF1015 domain-containing protein [Firmicutes bacterium]|nr:DUF1015 domain-containing protein [Bacillota bacterium]